MIRVAVLLLLAGTAWAEKWALEFFHDADKQTLILNDFKMLTPQRGIAVGVLLDKARAKPMAAVTSNGGKQWTLETLPDKGVSLFFLDDSTGWLVGEGGIWETLEGGRGWKRVLRHRGLQRVWFINRERGFAVGQMKTVLETRDGGKRWKPVESANSPSSDKPATVYDWIAFENEKAGLVTGYVQPKRITDPEYPIWMDPYPSRRPEFPRLVVFLMTLDGGDTWKALSSSLFGHVTRFRMLDRQRALVLLRFDNYFQYPSELMIQDRGTQKARSIFRHKQRSITDFHVADDGTLYIAGVETLGNLGSVPIPGKVKVMRSRDLQNWEEMPVDYRATAARVTFSGLGDKDIRLATDSGIILRLTP